MFSLPCLRPVVSAGRRFLLCCAVLAVSSQPVLAAEPQWIWASEGDPQVAPAANAYFRVSFEVTDPQSGQIEITGDNSYSLWINGERIGAGIDWNQIDRFDITSRLLKGKNVIAALGQNSDGPAGLVARVTIKEKGNRILLASTSASWKTATTSQPMWWSVGFDDSAWKPAHVFGEFGKTAPWGNSPKVVAAAESQTFTRKTRPAGPFQLLDGDRVVFLGDTLVERAQANDYIETALTSRFPDRNIVFRNLGWSADTVFGDSRAGFGSAVDGFLQLKQRVFEQKPTVIILGYGAAASSAGPEGLAEFTKGLETLLKTLEETQAAIVVLSPLRQEDLGRPLPDPTPFNENRKLYAQVLKSAADACGYPFVNVFDLLGDGKASPTGKSYTDNGIHLTNYGYWSLAPVLEAALGWRAPHWEVEIDAVENQHVKVGTRLSDITIQNFRSVQFDALDQTLPPPPAPRYSPAGATIPGLQRVLKVNGLAPGNYILRVDGHTVFKATAAEWTKGVSIPTDKAPEFQQAERLRQAILSKNQLFFHRWRPQNETYLFGFRKHEQGNNAKEIPLFDPLVMKVETEISRLRVPVSHRYQIVAE